MNDALIPAGTREEQWTSERCFIREIVNDPATPEASLAECRVLPGVKTELHRLAVAEWYLIRAGRGLMQVGDSEAFEVRAGDVVTIPAGGAQCIENVSPDDLVFWCWCLPRFTPDCYEALE